VVGRTALLVLNASPFGAQACLMVARDRDRPRHPAILGEVTREPQ
jgi:hypothetical protein